MTIHIETPLLKSEPLTRAAKRSVWLKMEAAQPPGSFKIRGVGRACEEYARLGKRRFISSSGGNAGLAVAYAGAQLGVPVVVVVPVTTTDRAKELIGQQGAKLIVSGASWSEANELAQSMTTDCDAFIHPFDDPLLWDGHATMIDEVAAVGFRPGAIVLSVGGGGLLAGVHRGMERNGWQNVPIIAVETRGAASFAESLRTQTRVVLDSINTIATSLGAKQICARAFELAQRHDIRSAVISDGAAALASERFLDDHRVLVEPACGASLSLAYNNAPELDDFENILLIVCGGATATFKQIQLWATELG